MTNASKIKIVVDDSARLKPLAAPENIRQTFGSKISSNTQKELRKVDSNIRNAEQTSGRLYVA